MKIPTLARKLFLLCTMLTAISGQALDVSYDAGGIDGDAQRILRDMADYYQRVRSFSVTARFAMVIESTGMRREIWSQYNVAIQRPNQAALQLDEGVGATIASDGKQLTVYVPIMGKFLQKAAPATIDAFFNEEGVTLVNQSMGNMLFLDALMKRRSYDALIENVTSGEYLGVEELDNSRVNHIRLRQGPVALELWIEDSETPVVRKISRNLSDAAAALAGDDVQVKKMEMATQFSNWSVDQKLPPSSFKVQLPDFTQRVASLFEAEPDSLIGKPAPKLKLELVDGKPLDLDKHKGKQVIVLDFWTSWCPPCQKGLVLMSELAKKYKGQNVAFYAVNVTESTEAIAQYIEENELAIPVAMDKDGKSTGEYGLASVPHTIVISKEGIVAFSHSGLQPDFKKKLSEVLDLLLKPNNNK